MKKKILFPLFVILLAVSLLACQVTSLFPVSAPTPTATNVPVIPVSSANPNLSDQQNRLMALYQQFSPGVVSIRTPDAQGSGWVYNSDGIIVTNNHVVGSETRVEIDFASGSSPRPAS